MKRAVLAALVAVSIDASAHAQAPQLTPRSLAECKADSCTFVSSWMNPDQSPATAALLAVFQKIDAALGEQPDQQQINATVNSIVLNNAGPSALPNANDLVYSTLSGQPYFSPDPRGGSVNPALNYAMHASAGDHPHVVPGPAFAGSVSDQVAYAKYIDTVLAAQSFGATVLTNHALADVKNVNPALESLLAQAKDPSATAAIATEDIGLVVRQLLLVERQNLVLLSELVQTEKQLLAAQAITNALLISTGTVVEKQLLAKAQGLPLP